MSTANDKLSSQFVSCILNFPDFQDRTSRPENIIGNNKSNLYWSSRGYNGRDTIELLFETPVYGRQLRIFEATKGGLHTIYVRQKNSEWIDVCRKTVTECNEKFPNDSYE